MGSLYKAAITKRHRIKLYSRMERCKDARWIKVFPVVGFVRVGFNNTCVVRRAPRFRLHPRSRIRLVASTLESHGTVQRLVIPETCPIATTSLLLLLLNWNDS